MQSKLVLSVVSAIFVVSLSACAPKDDKLPPKPGSNNVNQQSLEMNRVEYHKLSLVTFDRAFEALALLKAALNPQYAAQLKLTIDEKLQIDDITGDSAKILKNIGVNTTIVTSGASFVSQTNYQIEDLQINDHGQVVKFILKSNDTVELVSKGFLLMNGRVNDFKATTVADRIVIYKSMQEGFYGLEIVRIENTDSLKDKSSVISSQIKARFVWDGHVESLEQDVVVAAIQFKLSRAGQKKGALALKSLTTNIAVKLGACVSVSGELMLQKAKSNASETATQLVFKDSAVEIPQEKFSSTVQPCESRPLVDLTRML